MSFYRRWILACTAGELAGIGVATGAALALNALVGEPQTLPARLAVLGMFALVGALEGSALGGFEWRVLRQRLPQLGAREWVGATVAIAAAGWIAGMTPSLFFHPAVNPDVGAAANGAASAQEPSLAFILLLAAAFGAGAGLCFGGAQWIALRHHTAHAGRWIAIHVPAWALAMSAIFLGASLPSANSTT
jgi:hypothetical protein